MKKAKFEFGHEEVFGQIAEQDEEKVVLDNTVFFFHMFGALLSVEEYTPQPDPVMVKKEIVNATQQRLDIFAQTRNYDGVLSLCTYASSPNAKFQAEGQYGVEARDTTWTKLLNILAEVEAGTRPMPTGYAEIEPELPPLVWPN